MKKLHVKFKNCYGIQSLEHSFDFGNSKPGNKTVAIYAPNGLMKTSFTRTFERLALGKNAEEERYNRPSTSSVMLDGEAISEKEIYVLKSEIDVQEDSSAITDILVNPDHKSRYDAILVDLDKQKNKLIGSLQKASGVVKKDIERVILEDTGEKVFSACIAKLINRTPVVDASRLDYSVLFDPKAADVLKGAEFLTSAKEFSNRYQELFTQSGTIYQKGIFNPAKAETSFNTLEKQGFFQSGHKLQMRGDVASIDKDELAARLKKIHARIDEDENLKKIRTNLAKNAQTLALSDLIEGLSSTEVDELLDNLKPENQRNFKINLWGFYVQNTSEAASYLELSEQTKEEIKNIEEEAAKAAPRWTEAVALFNDRFVDMPFTLSVANQTLAALGKEKARLKFTFKDGEDIVEWSRSEIKTLSQGEKRALYLLNFIFEVEARSASSADTLFIIDDVADSFDYKNKHAIVQYLDDLDNKPNLYQLILTHNFDFFRTLANNFVHRDRCLMANRQGNEIMLSKADGIKNYFIGILKEKVNANPTVMCATIPFTRNIIEYTKGEDHDDYLKLTRLLHLMEGSESITTSQYLEIYNRTFGTAHVGTDVRVMELLYQQADAISNDDNHVGINLEDKVLLSMAARLKSEKYLLKIIRDQRNDQNYWCSSNNQFGTLMKEYSKIEPTPAALRVLEKVSITVSSNIHLNSFMYEPILDLTISHLSRLYKEVSALLEE